MSIEVNRDLPSWVPSELDKAAEALIGEIDSEYKDADLAEQAGADPEPSPEVSAAVPPEDAVSAPGGTPQPNTVDAPGLERLVAREVELRAREESVKAAEKRHADMEAKIARLESRALSGDLEDELTNNPAAVFERLGLDPDQMVRRVLAHRLGDKAPPELQGDIKSAQKDYEIRRELKALREEQANYRAQEASRAFVERVQAGARQYLTDPKGLSATPTVAAVAKANSERVYSEIMAEISEDARVKSASNPGAELISYQEAASRVEKRWAELKTAFTTSQASNAAPTKPGPGANPTPQSIRPPDRPLAPWLQRETEAEDVGLKAAVAEYRRLETPNR